MTIRDLFKTYRTYNPKEFNARIYLLENPVVRKGVEVNAVMFHRSGQFAMLGIANNNGGFESYPFPKDGENRGGWWSIDHEENPSDMDLHVNSEFVKEIFTKR